MRYFRLMLTALAVYVLFLIFMQWSELDELKSVETGETSSSTAITETVSNEEKRIALTFDDGPHPVYTVKLLEGLRERNVRATFFLVGSLVEQHPEIVQQMAEDGHLIGCHTYSHA